MFNVQEYLKKFSFIGDKQKKAIDSLKETVLLYGLDLKDYKISYKAGVYRVVCPNAVKNILFLKKQNLINEIKNKGVSVVDIC